MVGWVMLYTNDRSLSFSVNVGVSPFTIDM